MHGSGLHQTLDDAEVVNQSNRKRCWSTALQKLFLQSFTAKAQRVGRARSPLRAGAARTDPAYRFESDFPRPYGAATSTSQSTAGRQIIAHLANVGHADRHKSFQSPDRDSSPWRATLAAIGAVIESRPTAQVTRRDVLVAPTLQATGKAGLSPVVDADAEGGSLRILKMSRLCCAARLQKAFQRVVGSFCARLRWRFSASLQTWGSQPCAASFNASQPHIRFGYSFVPGISSPLSGKNGVKRPALARSGFRLSLAEKLPARF